MEARLTPEETVALLAQPGVEVTFDPPGPEATGGYVTATVRPRHSSRTFVARLRVIEMKEV